MWKKTGATRQQVFDTNNSSRLIIPQAAYVHFPFCYSKCNYCDFNSYPGLDSLHKPYINTLIKEINSQNILNHKPLNSVYFGGGTPSIIQPDLILSVLESIKQRYGFDNEIEITIEANPCTLDLDSLKRLREGFNRISIGIQSFNDSTLKILGRAHDLESAKNAVLDAKQADFENISIDLIYAVPEQNIDMLVYDLDSAVSLDIEHISLYELSIEENTPFYEMLKRKQIEIPDENTQIQMYEYIISHLKDHGYEHYEVSNFSKPEKRAVHNQAYWKNLPYYGFGAGAVSYLEYNRAKRELHPVAYISKITSNQSAIIESETLTPPQRAAESIMLGLRMTDGIEISEFNLMHNIDILSDYKIIISKLADNHLITISNGRLKTTFKGLLLLNEIAAEFINS